MRVHRDLQPCSLTDALMQPSRVMTMTEGQWDSTLAAAYELGWTLLELDEHEQAVRAYRKEERLLSHE